MAKQVFFKQFLKFIEKENLFSIQGHILLAVSGGIDSMVLCDLFEKAGFQYSIAHVNHKTRGESSELDQLFVKTWAKSRKAPFYSLSLSPEIYNKPGVNFQNYAREKRYAWFESLMQKQNLSYLATAHHKDDAIESALMNFAAGTGLRGMTGIKTKRGKVIRPLMFASKSEIIEYAENQHIEFRIDESNESEKYRRNAVRHRVIKNLVEIFPNFERTAFESIQHIKSSDELLEDLVKRMKSEWVQLLDNKTIIYKDKILQFKGAESLLYYLLKPFGFTSPQIQQIFEEERTGALFYSPNYLLLINRNEWIVQKKEIIQKIDSLEVNGPGTYNLSDTESIEIKEVSDYTPSTDYNIETVDPEKIKLPLSIRKWKEADVFQPIGMKGHSQKVQDLLTNHKVDRFSKNNTWILEDCSHIIWVIPYRLDARVKISKTSHRFWQIIYSKNRK